MARDNAYFVSENKIKEAFISGTKQLKLNNMQLTELPESLGQLAWLETLDLDSNRLTILPESICNLKHLRTLLLQDNMLKLLPESFGNLNQLITLGLGLNRFARLPDSILKLTNIENLSINNFSRYADWIIQLKNLKYLVSTNCGLQILPDWIGTLENLEILELNRNKISDLPLSLTQLKHLKQLDLNHNPLNPELAKAYEQGLDAIKIYLRAKAEAQITLNEAKLILVGEGEVGKTCLMDALLGKKWQEHPSTHGIEIQQVKITDAKSKKQITLNGWDFGGQRVNRPTHQLFFSAPAIYLVVWKPREGPQQGFVKEWIQLIKRREPSAKIILIATHGGPQQRQPDIDRQELYDQFSNKTLVDFFFVDSKPNKNGIRKGIDELKVTIARLAAELPEMGRSVPKNFQDVRIALQKKGVPYLPLKEVLDICREYKMDDEVAQLFITISHRLGHLTHYENDPVLGDIVILRPDWLATAMSYVLDDEETRHAHGLVKFSRLSKLWNDPIRTADSRYPATLHPIFLRLMERFDLSYRVAGLSPNSNSDPQYLIAQLVPDLRPENMEREWPASPSAGDIQQTQICCIVDAQNGQSASAEGLFYQLIVRLHKYSLGRVNYYDSVHWQRGLILDNDYNGRALLEYKGNDVHITVRAPYPERFLSMLTEEVRYLVESFWEGLHCDVMVPCIEPCGKKAPGTGMYPVEKLIDSKRKDHPEFPCPVCNEWQNIDCLLRNAPAARPLPLELLLTEFTETKEELIKIRLLLIDQQAHVIGRFDQIDISA